MIRETAPVFKEIIADAVPFLYALNSLSPEELRMFVAFNSKVLDAIQEGKVESMQELMNVVMDSFLEDLDDEDPMDDFEF